jgi:DNA-binding response OmpR family regulator
MNGISSASALKSGVRVLVIDDNQDLAEVLVEFLAESGCEVRSAGDGASGLSLFRSFAPEALLLDLGLPDMTGFDFVERLGEGGLDKSCVLIALSGYGSDQVKSRARELGFAHQLLKPVDFPVVLDILSQHFPAPR